MKVTIRKQETKNLRIPAALLGHNIEMTYDTDRGILSNRLANPHFCAPVDPRYNIAESWTSWHNTNFQGIRFEHLPHAGLTGGPAQVMNNFGGRDVFGMLQRNVAISESEDLEAVIWARTQSHPIRLRVMIKPLAHTFQPYAEGEILIDSAWYQEYRIPLKPSASDDAAAFILSPLEEGEVWFSYISLEPKGSGALCPAFLQAVEKLPMPVLRWPGGCITTAYHWKHSIGPRHLRPAIPDFVFKHHLTYDFGTEEYLELCEKLGAVPHITVNLTTGTPGDAAEWARFCAEWYRSRGKEPPLMYWHMGNEHYAFWEFGHMTADMYVKALKEYVPGIRTAYPAARIIALGVDEYDGRLSHHNGGPWREVLLRDADEFFDLLAFQWYRIDDWIEDDRERLISVVGSVDRLEGKLTRAKEDLKRFGKNKKLALSEWNLWTRAGGYDGEGFREPYDAEHAMFAAAVIHRLASHPDSVELAEIYHLINAMGVLMRKGTRVEETFMADFFRLYYKAFGGFYTEINLECGELAEGVPAIEALAVTKDNSVHICVVNRSLDSTASINLEGFGRILDVELMSAEALSAPMVRNASAAFKGSSVELPGLSIARITTSL